MSSKSLTQLYESRLRELQELDAIMQNSLSQYNGALNGAIEEVNHSTKMAYVTDDQTNFLKKFELIFNKMNLPYRLDKFTTSQDTLKNYQVGKYEMAFVDVNLAGSEIDGIQLVDMIKNRLGNHCTVTIISASDPDMPYAGTDVRFKGLTQEQAARKAGAEAWISKSGPELVDRITQFIDEKVMAKNHSFKCYA